MYEGTVKNRLNNNTVNMAVNLYTTSLRIVSRIYYYYNNFIKK